MQHESHHERSMK